MLRRYKLCLLLIMSGALCFDAAAQVRFEASVDKNVVALGDTLTLTLTMSGARRFSDPELPPLIGFDLLNDRGRSTSVSIVNGVMTSSVSRQYMLAPKETGTFVIGPASLRSGGEVYKTKNIRIEVVARSQLPQRRPTQRENLFATLVADKEEAFIGEQVNLYLRLYQRGVNLVGNPDADGPATDGFVRYDLPSKGFRVRREGLIYNVEELPIVLFPIRTGELTIPPVSIAGQVKVRAPRGERRQSGVPNLDEFFSDSFFDRHTVREYRIKTEPVTVTVKPVPEKGKPDFFTGTVGRYSLEVFAKPSQVKVGEPVTVTMRVSGTGNLEGIKPPVLGGTQNFKTYEPEITTDIVGKEPEFTGQKTFETVLVPQQSGRQVIPNVKVSFFDPEEKRYVTLAKGPFEFDVLPAPVEPMKRVVEVETGPGKTEIKVIGEDIAPVITKLGPHVNTEPVSVAAFGISLAAPPLAYALLLAAVSRRRKLASDVTYARKQRATREARRRLAAATKALKHAEGAAFYGEATKAITGFVADKTGVSAAGLTVADIEQRLDAAGVPEELVSRTVKILEACDYGRFAASAHKPEEMNAMLDGAKYVLSELQKVLGRGAGVVR